MSLINDAPSFHKALLQAFNLHELRVLCREAGENPDEIPCFDQGILTWACELILYFQRRNRLADLCAHCKRLRPNMSFNWEIFLLETPDPPKSSSDRSSEPFSPTIPVGDVIAVNRETQIERDLIDGLDCEQVSRPRGATVAFPSQKDSIQTGTNNARSSHSPVVGSSEIANQHNGDSTNTGGGAYIEGDVRAKVIVGHDQISSGVVGGTLNAQTINVFAGVFPSNSANAQRLRPFLSESIRLEILCPIAIVLDEEFDIAAVIRQPTSEPLCLEDLNNRTIGQGAIERESPDELSKFRVEVKSADFSFDPLRVTFKLMYGSDSEIKWFKATAKKLGRLSFLVIAYQVDDDIEIASSRIVLESGLSVRDMDHNDLTNSSIGHKLQKLINDKFMLGDIEQLCVEIGVDEDRLRDETKIGKVRALVLECEKNEHLDKLTRLMLKARPNLLDQLRSLGI